MFELDHVTLHGNHRPRLNDVSVVIPAGRTAIVGYSGAGKTSLLNVLAGFEQPDAGTARRLAENGEGRAERAGRLPLFWAPQNGGLWPHMTVDQHLECVSNPSEQPRDGGKREESRRSLDWTDEILSALDLVDRRSAFPAQLSQGERSRLALARALASRASVLLLDEPLSHVDPVRKPDYWKSVQRRMSQDFTSMVFSSHEPETVLRQAEHVICLYEGHIVFQGTTRTLYDSPPSREVGEFLGPLNWFEPEETVFLNDGGSSAEPVSVRPERLRLLAEESSPLQLVATPFRGGYAESIVKHVLTGRVRTVLHNGLSELPEPGAGVRCSVFRNWPEIAPISGHILTRPISKSRTPDPAA
jgi:ABC-type multidrug transport system ATPase subunit